MVNLIIFAITVASLFFGWILYRIDAYPFDKASWKKTGKVLAILMVLFMPLNINGNVWTILGNGESEKNMFSVASVYQKANGFAVSLFGVLNYQEAGDMATTVAGITGYQKADHSILGFGIAGVQEGNSAALTLVGAVGYQKAPAIVTIFGVGFYQVAGENSRTFGAWTFESNQSEDP